MARISRTGTTDSTGVASTTVTGSGGGRLKFISRNGELWSNSYEIEDLIFYDNATESSHNDRWYIRLPNITTMTRESDGTVIEWTGTYGHVECENGRYYTIPTSIEFDVLEQSNAMIQYYSGSATNIERSVSLTRTGHYRCINTLNSQKIYCDDDLLFESSISFNQYYFAFLSNVSGSVERMIKFSNFKVYPFFTAPKHYTPIELTSDKSTISTGESATLSAELTNVLGEKLASKSVNFIEKSQQLYETINTGDNVISLSLPSKFTIEFDLEVVGSSSTSNAFIRFNSSSGAYCGKGSSYSNNITFFGTTLEQINGKTTYKIEYDNGKAVCSSPTNSVTINNLSITSLYSLSRNGDTVLSNIKIYTDEQIGTGTTNSQGIATCNNSITGTGKGERQFIASSSSIQSEIYDVLDTVKFDNGTISSHNDIWDYDSSKTVLTRYDEYSSITEKVAGTDARMYCKNLPTSAVVEIELCQIDGEISHGGLNFYDGTNYRQYFALRELGYNSSIIGQWVRLRITYGNGSFTVVSLDDPTKTVTKTYNNNITSISPSTNSRITEHRFRNLRVYNP